MPWREDVFDRVSFDLIYARQNQSLADWEAELSKALEMAVDHLSLYQLTLEPGTAFWDRAQAGGLRGLPDEDLGADMFEATQKLCAEAGMAGYEVSNHARPGAESAHNLTYWRYGDWVGVGPGAHGRFSRDRIRWGTEAVSQPGAWLDRVEARSGQDVLTEITPKDAAGEWLMMGMRLSEGLDLDELHAMSRNIAEEHQVEALLELEMVSLRNGVLSATPQGRCVLNSVIQGLL